MKSAILSSRSPSSRSAGLRQAAGWAARRVRELGDLPARTVPSTWRGLPQGRPLPPRRLRARTGAPAAREFTHGGRRAALELSAPVRSSLHDLRAILDFGCGSGRVLPHFAALAPQARCSGCDIDATAIRWASRHLPRWRWRVSEFEPPLPFEAASFDLVYSVSVFSHLPEPLQDRWLSELARVLVPGGVALLSVHGSHAFEQFRTDAVRTRWCRSGAFDRDPLGPGEFVFEPYVRSSWNRGELPGVTGAYGLAFHGRDYVLESWSRVFEVLEIRERALSAWQDLVVCRVAID